MKKAFVILTAAVVTLTTLSCNKETEDILNEVNQRIENVFSLPGTTWQGNVKQNISIAEASANATVTFLDGDHADVNFSVDISTAGYSVYTMDTATTCQYRFVGVEGLLYDTNNVELTTPFKKVNDTTINLYRAMPSTAADYGLDTLVIPLHKVK